MGVAETAAVVTVDHLAVAVLVHVVQPAAFVVAPG